ncbi:hypothetical protein [Methylocystis parvus]|uniref:hypothetical protein n=1 Tax=Methylocystis parvus TaxID=134 RepID=UPI0002FA3C50|nr:hypothetical protein [Methylocystis parvus]WBJ99278.1 hypothetical protein MMG94_14925 [Methylocystis parvus OBBP]
MASKFDLIPGGKSDGGGAEDPMLEQRVVRLEEKVDRIEAILMRLEPKITEIALTGAKQHDLHKTNADLAELKGKVAGVEARFSSLPTTWTMLGIVFTTWAPASLSSQ